MIQSWPFPAWTICSARSCRTGKILGGIKTGSLYTAVSAAFVWCSVWVVAVLGLASLWFPCASEDGCKVFGRHSNMLSGSSGLLQYKVSGSEFTPESQLGGPSTHTPVHNRRWNLVVEITKQKKDPYLSWATEAINHTHRSKYEES